MYQVFVMAQNPRTFETPRTTEGPPSPPTTRQADGPTARAAADLKIPEGELLQRSRARDFLLSEFRYCCKVSSIVAPGCDRIERGNGATSRSTKDMIFDTNTGNCQPWSLQSHRHHQENRISVLNAARASGSPVELMRTCTGLAGGL